jgi:predicted alpha/beta superfamily hydrolase
LNASGHRKRVVSVFLGLLLLAAAAGAGTARLGAQERDVQEPPRGRVVEPIQRPSELWGEERTVRIYLPPSYDRDPQARFPVLYVHDGQNVFSTAGPGVAFGWGSWEVDRTIERLAAEGQMREIMVVAVDNTRRRMQEYRGPGRPLEAEPDSAASQPTPFQLYQRFLVEELKPWVDREYRTLPGPSDIGIMGSSLGGICSLALAWERPDVFGKAASLSGSFQLDRRWFLEGILQPHGDPPKPIRIYLDSGARSGGGDDGAANTAAVAAELLRIGWRDGSDLLYHLDAEPLTPAQLEPLKLDAGKFAEAQRSQHNELYWRLRVWRALEFLFPPT